MVEDLLAARLQMAISLGFHIVFACVGMTMPWLMAAAEFRYLKHGDPEDMQLAKMWSKGVAVLFAVGAVSGTVLSFELGLLWPKFMEHAGPIIGLPFSWEGTAFFLEAIALGLFLYGWNKLSPRAHFASGVAVGICGVASGVLVVAANGWMNSPRGVRFVDGEALDVDPVAAMFNDAWLTEALHMTIASFEATCFLAAGVHAFCALRAPSSTLHRRGLRTALLFGGIAAVLQPISGDLSAKDVAQRQPEKLAAMEAHYHTEAGASLVLGGIPDDETETVHYALSIPYALSVLAHGDPSAEVVGLDAFPKDERPPTLVTHVAFQIMVGCGTVLALFAVFTAFVARRRRAWLDRRAFLMATMAVSPLGFVALEAGWTVTEVGRQPWIIYRVMRTAEAVTPMPGIAWTLLGTCVLYALLGLFAAVALWRIIVAGTAQETGGRVD